MPTDRPTCETCPYWHEHGVHEDPAPDAEDAGMFFAGICRRHAPTAALNTDWRGEHPGFPKWVQPEGMPDHAIQARRREKPSNS